MKRSGRSSFYKKSGYRNYSPDRHPLGTWQVRYKLIQYMACGLPVVASPVGLNKEIIEHGVNGFLAESDAEWRTAIEVLISDPDLRCRMEAAGRKKVENEYSLQVWGLLLANMLRRVTNKGTST
ncbi:glycosyltransferase [Amylibacter sp.]|nr:glycosyltransferase [Amylibacter sp.]